VAVWVKLPIKEGAGIEEILEINVKRFRLMTMDVAGFQKYLSIFTGLHGVTCRKAEILNNFNP